MHTFTDFDSITKRSDEVYIQGVHSIAIYQDSRNGDRIYCSSSRKHQLYIIKILPQSVIEVNQITGRRQLAEITIYGGLGKGDSPGYNVDQDYALYANYNFPTQIVAIKNSALEPSLYIIDNEEKVIRCIHAAITREVSYTGLIRAGPVSYFGNSNMRLADGIGYDQYPNNAMNIDISGGGATGETLFYRRI
jgi:hypothetical protein